MIKTLRKRFIRTAMVSVLIVLVVILVAINALNYRSFIKESDERISMVERAGGNLSDMRERQEPPASADALTPPQKPSGDPGMAEAPYDTRYFSAELDSHREIISTNMTDIASITQSQAEKMITDAVASGNDEGRMGVYRYRLSQSDSGHYLIVFLNVSRDLSSVHSFLRASVIVGVIGVAAILVLMEFLTKLAMAPAETAFEKQKQFITDASHEIKTPLAIIESNAEVIEMEDGDSKWVDNIKNQITRLTGLTEKLVLLSRMDEAGYRTALTSFDLSELLRATADEYQGKPLHIDSPDYLPYYGSRENIGRMLSMLFDNAEKYSTGDISVKLTGTPKTYTKIRRHGYTLTVSNPADGMQAGNLDKLFDRFSRLDTSRNRKTGGSGIGLAVVSEIARYHRGEVHASSDGHIFVITIVI